MLTVNLMPNWNVLKKLIEDILFPFLSFVYLKITDGKSHIFGKHCGERFGEHVMITFHTDDIEQRRGFLIFITAVPLGKFIILS